MWKDRKSYRYDAISGRIAPLSHFVTAPLTGEPFGDALDSPSFLWDNDNITRKEAFMKHCTAILVTLLLLFSCSACGGGDTLTGTWEGPMETTVLGTGTEDGDVTATIRFTFQEDGSGATETDFGSDLPAAEAQTYQYTTDGDALTLTFEDGQTQTYTYQLDGDTLTLEGRADLTLTRTE